MTVDYDNDFDNLWFVVQLYIFDSVNVAYQSYHST